jgi:hypothetical protein
MELVVRERQEGLQAAQAVLTLKQKSQLFRQQALVPASSSGMTMTQQTVLRVKSATKTVAHVIQQGRPSASPVTMPTQSLLGDLSRPNELVRTIGTNELRHQTRLSVTSAMKTATVAKAPGQIRHVLTDQIATPKSQLVQQQGSEHENLAGITHHYRASWFVSSAMVTEPHARVATPLTTV